MTKVSVVIPTYNRANVLPRAIDSVLQQTHENIELIVVDDSSTDNTREVVESYNDNRIRYTRLDSNSGANTARNTGINISSGDYIAFLDSDDEWLPSKISKQLNTFKYANNSTGLVYTGRKYIGQDDELNAVVTPKLQGDVSGNMLADNFVGTFSTALIKKSILEVVEPPDESFDSGQDWEFFTRISFLYEFGVVDEPMVKCYTQQNNRISSNHDPRSKYSRFRDKFESEITDNGLITRRKIHSKHMFRLGYSYTRRGDMRSGIYALCRSILFYPLNTLAYVHLISCLGGAWTNQFLRKIKRKILRYYY